MIVKVVDARRLLAVAMLLGVLAGGCGEDVTPPTVPETYKYPVSPANVLYNLQQSYSYRDIEGYGFLLARDFRFYFDQNTRITKNLPEFWNRLEDSLHTEKLFKSQTVEDIRVSLRFGNPKSVGGAGRKRWLEIDVQNVLLEVDMVPVPGMIEGVTLRVDGQIQKFFFRQGLTPEDTLATSPTARRYYLVEWRDQGMATGALRQRWVQGDTVARSLPPVGLTPGTTWSGIKTRYLK